MKAQSSTEFMFTYGWAILIVILAFGGLAYLGVLDFGKLLPNKCFFGAGVSCKDQTYATLPGGNTNVTAILTNTFGIPINISTVIIEDANSGCACIPDCNIENQEWLEDTNKVMNIQCTNPQDRINIKVKIKYRLADGQYDRVVEGVIQTRS